MFICNSQCVEIYFNFNTQNRLLFIFKSEIFTALDIHGWKRNVLYGKLFIPINIDALDQLNGHSLEYFYLFICHLFTELRIGIGKAPFFIIVQNEVKKGTLQLHVYVHVTKCDILHVQHVKYTYM